jgi:hypothetical protein
MLLVCHQKLNPSSLCTFQAVFPNARFQILEAAAHEDAFKGFVVAVMRAARVFGHFFRTMQISDGRKEMHFAGEEDSFGASGDISLSLLGQLGDRGGVPANVVGVGEPKFEADADRADPYPVLSRGGRRVRLRPVRLLTLSSSCVSGRVGEGAGGREARLGGDRIEPQVLARNR